MKYLCQKKKKNVSLARFFLSLIFCFLDMFAYFTHKQVDQCAENVQLVNVI